MAISLKTISVGDVIIARFNPPEDKPKAKVARKAIMVTSKGKGTITGTLVNSMNHQTKDEEIIEAVKVSDIILNLGDDPDNGNVYGTKLNFLKGTTESKAGPVLVFREIDSEDLKRIIKGIDASYKKLKKLGLDGVFPCRFELHEPGGKYSGSFKTHKVNKGELDVIVLKPLTFDADEIDHILTHEVGHGFEMRLMGDKMRSKWIESYHNHVTLDPAKSKDIEKARKGLVKAGCIDIATSDCLSDFASACLDACIEYIQDVHFLSKVEVDILLMQGDDLKDKWPTANKIDIGIIESPIGEYSEKDWHEYFCEALRIGTCKSGVAADDADKLPKDVQSLLDKTIVKLRGKKVDRSIDEE